MGGLGHRGCILWKTNKIENVWNHRFNCPKVSFKFNNVYVCYLWLKLMLKIISKLMIRSRLQIFMRGLTEDDFLKSWTIIQNILQISGISWAALSIDFSGRYLPFIQNSTGLLFGNQVDGAVGAWHDEQALWGAKGFWASAYRCSGQRNNRKCSKP